MILEFQKPTTLKELEGMLEKIAEADLVDGCDIYNHPCMLAIRMIDRYKDMWEECSKACSEKQEKLDYAKQYTEETQAELSTRLLVIEELCGELVKALEIYGVHAQDCAMRMGFDTLCDCGLCEPITKATEKLGDKTKERLK